MKLPSKLEKMRDELADSYFENGKLKSNHPHDEDSFRDGFNAACEELLPLIDRLKLDIFIADIDITRIYESFSSRIDETFDMVKEKLGEDNEN